ncbi:LOW QUALITY PROTEIN: uncharacterized protein LOC129354134 [Poeciliopsis prolifica]|uniref:LOW QUALITY PROTEIN: uncharacterized protein LOC129354134 n=1 Tax=Poeciliopsis prolifica TaxID=188132 RepID=UPI002414461A|nr:LOW QUALITY PROTEIN: uncharacterized protein LOC129354134 [Poeciliopsis prolifica]
MFHVRHRVRLPTGFPGRSSRGPRSPLYIFPISPQHPPDLTSYALLPFPSSDPEASPWSPACASRLCDFLLKLPPHPHRPAGREPASPPPLLLNATGAAPPFPAGLPLTEPFPSSGSRSFLPRSGHDAGSSRAVFMTTLFTFGPNLLTSSLISSMDSLQRSISSLSALLHRGIPDAVNPSTAPSTSALASLHPAPQALLTASTLATARPAPLLGMPYTPRCANVSPRLRAKILQGQYINLATILLPSPEVDQSVATDVICTLYPERRIELDAYLALITDLHIQYGRSLFYQYHKAFASKAAAVLSHSGQSLNWSILDMEILIMLTQSIPCFQCGSPLLPSSTRDRYGREVKSLQGPPSKVRLSPPPIPRQKQTGFQKLVSLYLRTPILTIELANLLQRHPDRTFSLSCSLRNCLRVTSSALLIPPPFPVFRINPLGVATRKYSGKKRLILDLAAPHSGPHPSINSLIPKPPFSLFYATVDHAFSLIKSTGRGAWLAKADITDAFKIMLDDDLKRGATSQWHLQGAKWDDKFYFFVRLTFGCRSSPGLFNMLSEALCWILLNVTKLPSVLHLLDDFLLIDPPSHPSHSLQKLKDLFTQVGVPLSEDKTAGPSTVMEFLGISLDSEKMLASLPTNKLAHIRETAQAHLSSSIITKRQLLSLLEHLNFAMRIIPQGRSFISRLLDLTNSVPSLLDQVSLDDGCRSDLHFWSKLLNHWNGISFFYDDIVLSAASIQFYTDTAPSAGYGRFFQGQWFAEKWPTSFLQSESSAFYEIIPIAAACCLWRSSLERKRIVAMCDNAAVVDAINKGRSSSPSIMPFLRRITWQSVIHNFILTSRHVPGYSNSIADSLSRVQF